ncbi:MAG: inorganic diphosphatase [Ardenticatenaceae bacterium]|nr:inorganic diphosphatase [Ardenticatenaceae bacterium]HBY94042.1 inorganic pyrophosphatase [Chloroflexota bacterium]
MNLWHDLPSGPNPPDVIHVIVEIPKGQRNKYEFDHDGGFLRLDRVLYSPLHYPGDYGLIPRTLYDDGDPLDVLVMISEPTFPGCVLEARPIGLFRMVDQNKPDDKILAVAARDPLYADMHALSDVPAHYLREVEHFFSVYKDLEGKRVKAEGWELRETALQRIEHARRLYAEYRKSH